MIAERARETAQERFARVVHRAPIEHLDSHLEHVPCGVQCLYVINAGAWIPDRTSEFMSEPVELSDVMAGEQQPILVQNPVRDINQFHRDPPPSRAPKRPRRTSSTPIK